MKHFLYNYQTIFRFDAPVTRHFFMLRCVPCESTCQHLVHQYDVFHPVDKITHAVDVWGNAIQYGHKWDSHTSFAFVSTGVVELSPYALPDVTPKAVYRLPSPLTAYSHEMDELMADDKPSILRPFQWAVECAQRIHQRFTYQAGVTNNNTTAAQVMRSCQGVCQDYAHVLLACCRKKGVAARYVNGFMTGVGQTHAWVEVWDDGLWRGIDPTNNQVIEYGYIKLAHGRDAADCPVNRGVFTGVATQQMEVIVAVEEV